jgi:hypothetical protein
MITYIFLCVFPPKASRITFRVYALSVFQVILAPVQLRRLPQREAEECEASVSVNISFFWIVNYFERLILYGLGGVV